MFSHPRYRPSLLSVHFKDLHAAPQRKPMMKISWVGHVTNGEVSLRAGTEQKIMKAIRKRQIEFLGHVMRKEGLEN